jgi:hypothetical protein
MFSLPFLPSLLRPLIPTYSHEISNTLMPSHSLKTTELRRHNSDPSSSTSSSSSLSSRSLGTRYHASLLPVSAHDPSLIRLMNKQVSSDMIEHIARLVVNTVQIAGEPLVDSPFSSSPTRPRDERHHLDEQVSSMEQFIRRLVDRANVQTPTLLCTIIYLERLRPKLTAMTKGSLSSISYHLITLFTL